jgi:excisionase family DNA binding protein
MGPKAILDSESAPMPKIDEYLTIKEAARFLGVAPNTLRAWGASGKIPMHRNPINDYRLFRISDLQKLLGKVERSRVTTRANRRPR